MNGTKPRGLGWMPDLPDVRDYTEETPDVRTLLAPTGVTASAPGLGGHNSLLALAAAPPR